MLGFRLTAPAGDRLDLLDQLVAVGGAALRAGDQVEDQQREDVAAPHLAAEDVRRPAPRRLARGLGGARGLARGGTGGLSLARGRAGCRSSSDVRRSILGSAFASSGRVSCDRSSGSTISSGRPTVQTGDDACNNGYTRLEESVMEIGPSARRPRAGCSAAAPRRCAFAAAGDRRAQAAGRACARRAPPPAQPCVDAPDLPQHPIERTARHARRAGAHAARCAARSTAGRRPRARSTAVTGRARRC